MRKISTKIAKRLKKAQSIKIVNIAEVKAAKLALSQEWETLQDSASLVKKGHGVQHAIYTSVQNVLSLLIEIMSELKELDKHNKIIEVSQEMYTPSWPPLSPLSSSYYFTWSAFDVKVGLDKESYTSCLLDIRRTLGLAEDTCRLAAQMESSRLGIYKVIDQVDDTILLEELINKKRYHCVGPANYPFNAGELWLVRLFPPVNELFHSHVIFTSPYILLAPESEWLEFLHRNIKGIRPSPAYEKAYNDFMKNGLSHYYWPEFIMQGYSNYTELSILLAGIPDIAKSRPHNFDNQILPEKTF